MKVMFVTGTSSSLAAVVIAASITRLSYVFKALLSSPLLTSFWILSH